MTIWLERQREKKKIHLNEVKEFLKYVMENPDHKIRIKDMYSEHEALFDRKDVPWFKIYDDQEDDECTWKFVDYREILEALNLIVEE